MEEIKTHSALYHSPSRLLVTYVTVVVVIIVVVVVVVVVVVENGRLEFVDVS